MMCWGFVRRGFAGRARAAHTLGLNAPEKGAAAAATEGKANLRAIFALFWRAGGRVCAGGEEYSLKELLERTEVCLA